MGNDVQDSILKLANVYAKYFVEDFATNVMQHLKASHPLPDDYLHSYITSQVASHFNGDTPVGIANVNPATKFIYECAKYAIEKDIGEASSRTMWELISNLPSQHHEEIAALIYSSAILYNKTVSHTLLGVVAKDAEMAAKTILQAVQARVAETETGGNLLFFNWGILNDGLWLNPALMRAYELASIFRPGDPVVSYYSTVAFDFARKYTVVPILTDDDQTMVRADIGTLIGQVNDSEIDDYLKIVGEMELIAILFSSGVLSDMVENWAFGMNKPETLVATISKMTAIMRLVESLMGCAKAIDEDQHISSVTRNRLDEVHKALTLSLVGYAALRETKLAQALILSVYSEGPDPKVEVVINNDVIDSYRTAGGEDADLIRFGLYLDPRRGLPIPAGGYSLQFVMSRRDDVIPQIMSEDADRLEKLRNNDAAVINAVVVSTVQAVASSYAEARGNTAVPTAINQRILGLGRAMTAGTAGGTDLTTEIFRILLEIIGDPFLTATAERMVGHMSSDNEQVRQLSAGLTIANTAIADAIDHISGKSEDA